jgi:hypothetical protein
MPYPKFSFVPERQLGTEGKDGSYRVSIMKNGVILFSKDTIDVYELDGKHIKMFADLEKKVIGWSIIEGKTHLDDLDNSRIIKRNQSGCAVLGITKILKKMGIEKGTVFHKLEVKKYKSALNTEDIWYIELTKTHEQTK